MPIQSHHTAEPTHPPDSRVPTDAPIRGSKAADSLKFIGMPVGGIGCGTVYLGGDGRLWVWDVFNEEHLGVVPQRVPLPPELAKLTGTPGGTLNEAEGANYVSPPTPDRFPGRFAQGFGLIADEDFREFREADWSEVEFEGTWPVGTVRYTDPKSQTRATLKAFSPFIPRQLEHSSYPATCMEFTVENRSGRPRNFSLRGWMENGCAMEAGRAMPLQKFSRTEDGKNARVLVHEARYSTPPAPAANRPDLPLTRVCGAWVPVADHDQNQNTCTLAGTECAPQEHARICRSDAFTLERNFLECEIDLGPDFHQLELVLEIDGQAVREFRIHHMDRVNPGRNQSAAPTVTRTMDTSEFTGQKARLTATLTVGGHQRSPQLPTLKLTDRPSSGAVDFERLPDWGTLALGCLDPGAQPVDTHGLPGWAVDFRLEPGQRKTAVFVSAWHFPNLYPIQTLPPQRRAYATRFADAGAVAGDVAANYATLRGGTFNWVDTWYDSNLPRWVLDRSLLTTNTLQTDNCLIFDDGRFWAWEGIGCCAGTCTHVWQYAQGVAALFPELERNLRERTDFAHALDPASGVIQHRGVAEGRAVDGQAGCILRTWREHRMSVDDRLLRQLWPKVRLAAECLIAQTGGEDGLLTGAQHNTLDEEWFGRSSWLSGLYLAALAASARMADEMNDAGFRDRCRSILAKGLPRLKAELFHQGRFINRPDSSHLHRVNSGLGSHIDQMFGQTWTFLTGLDRVFPELECRQALASLWKYNFHDDIGPYRSANPRGRWYALPGESGMVMCTFPDDEWTFEHATGFSKKNAFAGYFNECMSGFEYQVAAHMIWEGTPDLVEKGLAVARAVHDRYSPSKRNPYNEIECSDHYARAGASFAVFLALCGFRHHGPQGHLAFAPRIRKENFRAPFLTAEGWGTFSQQVDDITMTAELHLRHGQLTLSTLELAPERFTPVRCSASIAGQDLELSMENDAKTTTLHFVPTANLKANQVLQVCLL